MNQKPGSEHFFGGMNVLSPEIPDANPIQVRDWDYLRKKIEDMPSVKSIGLLSYIGSVLSGIAGTAFFCAVSLLGVQIPNDFVIIVWTIAIAALAIGIICFLFSYTTTKESKNDAIELMDHIQGIWKKKEQTN